MTPFFYNGGSDPHNIKLADKIAMSSVLLKHLQVKNLIWKYSDDPNKKYLNTGDFGVRFLNGWSTCCSYELEQS